MLKANVTIVTDNGNIAAGQVFDPKEFGISDVEATSLVGRNFAEDYVEVTPEIAAPVKAATPPKSEPTKTGA